MIETNRPYPIKQLWPASICMLILSSCASQSPNNVASTGTVSSVPAQPTVINTSETFDFIEKTPAPTHTPTTLPTIVPPATATPPPPAAITPAVEPVPQFQLMADHFILPDDYEPDGQHQLRQKVIFDIDLTVPTMTLSHILDEAPGGGMIDFENSHYFWTPEGSVSRLEGDWQIWQIDLPSETRSLLVPRPEEEGIVSYLWSLTDDRLAYQTNLISSNPPDYTVWVTTPPLAATPVYSWQGNSLYNWAWTQDNKLIFFTQGYEAGTYSAFTIDPEDGTQQMIVTDKPEGSSLFGSGSAISEDGTQYVYDQNGAEEDEFEIWLLDIPTGQEEVILTGPYEKPSWTPQGTLLVREFIPYVGYRLYEVEADGTNLQLLEDILDTYMLIEGSLSWSDDGNWLAVTQQHPSFLHYDRSLHMLDRSDPDAEPILFVLPENTGITYINLREK